MLLLETRLIPGLIHVSLQRFSVQESVETQLNQSDAACDEFAQIKMTQETRRYAGGAAASAIQVVRAELKKPNILNYSSCSLCASDMTVFR